MALFDFAFEHAPIGIALVDTKGRIIKGNAAFSKLVGRPLDMVEGTPFSDFTHPEDLQADLDLFDEVLSGTRDGYTIEKRYIRPDASLVNVLIHVAAMRDESGEVVRFITQIEDITHLKKNERDLAERAAQLELAMEAIRGGFWHMDVPTLRFETSERLAHFIGGPDAARMDLDHYLQKIKVEDTAAADLTPLLSGALDQSVAEYRLDTVAGERWMRCDRRLLRDADGRPLRIVGVAIDFTEERRRYEDMERNSETDLLTGLLNRRGLAKHSLQVMSPDGFALLAIDLDGFKQVNDLYGHPGGDGVLVETARRLTALVRKSDLVCRTGGDEFVLVIYGGRATGEAIAQRVVEAMREAIFLPNGHVHVSASVGGVWTQGQTDIEHLLIAADTLLYEAKAEGKNGWRFVSALA
jgi:diguanylate cyclase (GGDEF)-like protein/PAS domain S-box-containing protein